jgi:hypothetical protein
MREGLTGEPMPFQFPSPNKHANGIQKFFKNIHWNDKMESDTMELESPSDLLRFDSN